MMHGISPFAHAERKGFGDFISTFLKTSTFTQHMQTLLWFSQHELFTGNSFLSFLLHTAKAVLMDKLADINLCGDTGCSYVQIEEEHHMSVSLISY